MLPVRLIDSGVITRTDEPSWGVWKGLPVDLCGNGYLDRRGLCLLVCSVYQITVASYKLAGHDHDCVLHDKVDWLSKQSLQQR